MRRNRWIILAAVVLLTCSALLYTAHYLIFHQAHHIFIYLLGDAAFVPLEVLLVVIIIERVLAAREKRAILGKMNMLIGMFFSELGTELLGMLTEAVQERQGVFAALGVGRDWGAGDFRRALAFARSGECKIDVTRLELGALRDLLTDHRSILTRLLGNPNLIEHEQFTNLLWAVSHLMEELVARASLDDLPETDREHLAGDVARVYGRLTAEWVSYSRHLQSAYPYIFSVLTRTHPLQENPDPTVR